MKEWDPCYTICLDVNRDSISIHLTTGITVYVRLQCSVCHARDVTAVQGLASGESLVLPSVTMPPAPIGVIRPVAP